MATKRSAYDFYPTPATAIQSFLEADKDNWINNELYTVLNNALKKMDLNQREMLLKIIKAIVE